MSATSLLQHQAFIRAQHFTEAFPASRALEVEDAEIERDELGVVCRCQSVYRARKLVGREFIREIAFDLAITIVLDAYAIAECFQNLLLAFHEPDLEEVLADGVTGAELQGFVKPSELISGLLFLNEDGAELPVRCQASDGGVVESFFVLTDPLAHLGDESGLKFLINFVGVHSCVSLVGVNTPHW